MINTYTPGQPQTGKNSGRAGDRARLQAQPEVRIRRRPTAEALTGLEGRVWIDAKTQYLVRMEGTIFRPINFGWGMLAHIYPGGKLVMNQTDAGGDRWIFTHFTDAADRACTDGEDTQRQLRARRQATSRHSAPMSYQDAIHLLLNTPLPDR